MGVSARAHAEGAFLKITRIGRRRSGQTPELQVKYPQLAANTPSPLTSIWTTLPDRAGCAEIRRSATRASRGRVRGPCSVAHRRPTVVGRTEADSGLFRL